VRTIILLIDYPDSTLWWREPDSGSPVDEALLPISSDLKQQLKEYYRTYSELYLNDSKEAVADLEKRLLDGTGLELWRRLRTELAGKYHVLFHSEEFACDFDNPDEFLAARKSSN
jgi:hypothetical protein